MGAPQDGLGGTANTTFFSVRFLNTSPAETHEMKHKWNCELFADSEGFVTDSLNFCIQDLET